MTCEIYICKPGQQLKEGRMEMNYEITTKGEAISDAERRIASSPGIAKIAYYKLSDDGSFRALYTHVNEKVDTSPKQTPRRHTGGGGKLPPKPKKKAKPKTFWQKLTGG